MHLGAVRPLSFLCFKKAPKSCTFHVLSGFNFSVHRPTIPCMMGTMPQVSYLRVACDPNKKLQQMPF